MTCPLLPQFTKQHSLWQPVISHPSIMTQPIAISTKDQLIPNLSPNLREIILCYHCSNLVTPRIVRTHLLWNTVKCRICSAFEVHVSAPYIRTGTTTAWYTALLESSELLKTARFRQPKALAHTRTHTHT